MRLVYLITADKQLSFQLEEGAASCGLFIRSFASLEECFLEPFQADPSLFVVDSLTVDVTNEAAYPMLRDFQRKVPLVILVGEKPPSLKRNGFSILPRKSAHLELLDRFRKIGT